MADMAPMLLLHLQAAGTIVSSPHATLCLVRHGQSAWNAAHRFTGWTDVDLTDLGRHEAKVGGHALREHGVIFDRAFTSELHRAQETLAILLHSSGQHDIPVMRHWRLNERHYGGLQGRRKQACVDDFGIEQVRLWRNSYAEPPPRVTVHSPAFPGNDPKYAHVPPDLLPRGECLKDTLMRALPLWRDHVVPELAQGRNVVVAAHGHSIRALVKVLDDISDEDISSVSIPNGRPLLYNLDESLRPIRPSAAASPLGGTFLAVRELASSAGPTFETTNVEWTPDESEDADADRDPQLTETRAPAP